MISFLYLKCRLRLLQASQIDFHFQMSGDSNLAYESYACLHHSHPTLGVKLGTKERLLNHLALTQHSNVRST